MRSLQNVLVSLLIKWVATLLMASLAIPSALACKGRDVLSFIRAQTILAVIWVVLSGCAKTPFENFSGSVSVSGVIQAGRVSHAVVEVYAIEDGKRGKKLGSSVSNSRGEFSAKALSHSGAGEVVAKGG